MPLSPDDLKQLIRMKGIADELLTSIRSGPPGAGTHLFGADALAQAIGAVIDQVTEMLDESDATELAEEFREAVLNPESAPVRVHASAAALAGWLAGTIAAESFEQRLQAEASAYAEARVREERKTGFQAPPASK